MLSRSLFSLIASLLISSAATADVVLEMERKDWRGNVFPENTISVKDQKVRLDNVGGVQGHMSMIFEEGAVTILNHDEKTWQLMDDATFARLGGAMSEAMKMLEAQLAQMPPEQRAMAQEMMKGQMQLLGKKPPEAQIEVVESGASQWQSYACTEYKVLTGGNHTQTLCAAGEGQIDGGAELRAALESMATQMEKLSRAFAAGPLAKPGRSSLDLLAQINGYPVLTQELKDGEVMEEIYLARTQREALPPALFEVPEGYRREDLDR